MHALCVYCMRIEPIGHIAFLRLHRVSVFTAFKLSVVSEFENVVQRNISSSINVYILTHIDI